MAKTTKKSNELPEIQAISAVYTALKDLEPTVQIRVLRYTADVLGLNLRLRSTTEDRLDDESPVDRDEIVVPPPAESASTASDDIDGVNAVALKWIRRSGLDQKELQSLFSLGIDEIDLVAKSVPGSSKRERMRNVLLLKGIAAYLGTGAARVSHDQAKEACLHYDAYDVGNFARYLKDFGAEVGGTKESGYTLTARGLTAATELIKDMLAKGKQ